MSIVALCQQAARRCPEAPLFSYLMDGETQAVSLTRGELHRQACRIAAELLARGLGGRRVLLLYVPGLDFIVSFVACLYAGAVAVPAYPPEPARLPRTLPRLAAIVADCAPALVLTTSQLLELAPLLCSLAPELAQVTWAASDSWTQAASQDFAPPLPRPDDLAFIQYTSGSTAMPKGVMIGHDHLIANLRQLQHARRGGEHTTVVSWLPFYHDLGLIGAILFPLFLGGRSILMSPIDFLKRPVRWLRAIDRYRADTSAAPNFALDLCVRKVTAPDLAGLDLSCWTMALIGAEPLQKATLDRFAVMLAPHGLHPHTLFQGYGLAEGILASVCGSIDEHFRSGSFDAASLREGRVTPTAQGAAASRMLVSCGTPVLDQRVEIVDPVTQERCEPDRVGEIWIAGPNVARGYWNRPEQSLATFGAQLPGSDARFLRTGDLGFFADGELYVAGRLKDLIIIHGKNHYPQDIEQTVQSCHPMLRPGCIAAFSGESGSGERLVIAAEIDARALPGDARAAAIAQVCEAIRREVSQQHELPVHAIALLEPGQLPKTSSGKLMRRVCRSEFLTGKLAAVEYSLLAEDASAPRSARPALAPELRNESGLAAWIKVRLVERLGVAPQAITAELPFAELGLDSREAIGLVGDLETVLDRKLPATLLFDYPNISALARFLSGADSRPRVTAAAAAPAPHAHQRGAAAQLDPATARICIIGAGPAGLTAAYDLSQLGYRHITILEKRREVGGKVMSVEYGGGAYELGQLFFTSAYKQTLELLRAFDVPLEHNAIATCHINVHGQPLPPPSAAAAHAWMMRLLAIAGFRGDELAVHAAHDRPELWEPMQSWLKRRDLWPLPQNVLISWTAFGYGFPTDGLPIWYLLTYVVVLLGITTAERYSVPGGNQLLWQRIAAHLQSRGVELRTRAQVRQIERTGSRVDITLDGQSPREFDALILACPPDAARSLLPPSAPERELLAAFRHYDYVSAMFLTQGLGSQRQFSFERSFYPDRIGEVLCFEHRPESSVATLGQYGSPYGQFAALGEAELTAFAQSAIERLGGRMVKPLSLERWRFFFHLSPANMQRGVLGALEARQGAERTFFTGSYLTMETLEHTVAYTRELIAHFFAPGVAANASQPTPTPAAAEPIAIIGMGCRLPGGADDPAAFWQFLERGGDAISEVPTERWSAERFYSADPAMPGRTISRWGGFLRNLDGVDPGFFGLSSREARSLDPQGRLLLEVSWEALEDAGIVPGQLMGSDTGVFVGLSGVEYQLYAMSDPQAIDSHSILGSMHSTIAGRLSYWLGLKGPNLPVDTACSSSLVALHLACQALRRGECSLALTGGANVVLSAEGMICFSKAGVLSPTGRCRTFSSDADGIVRADGCGVLVLKRLGDAQRDGDRVLGLVRGSAINQDGRSNGLTAPSGLAQQEVIRRALADARLDPGDIDYVECHGTGTALGDPIEVQALGSVFKDRPRAQPLRLGSVKTNIGHAEAAAGVAGVIKAVLALRHQRIPQSLHFTAPNPHIRWSELPVQVAATALPWPAMGRPRRAGVSAFGLSGTNAHVILEEAPVVRSSAVHSPHSLPVLPFVISGKTRTALQAQAARLRAYLEAQPQLALPDVAWSLATSRTHFEERAVVLTAERAELLSALAALASGQDAASLVTARPGARGRLAMLFTGQGSQRPGMGRELYEHFPRFRQALDQICKALDPHLPRPLLSVLFAETESAEAALLDQTEFTQPALFALEVALFRLWEAWGVRPALVAGHSVGELAAAHVAGVFSLEEASWLVAARGRLMATLPPGGAMVALAAEEKEVRKLLRQHGGRVDIAAQNAPLATVIAGDEAAVLAIGEHFAALGRSTSRLAVSHAFHSAHMEPMLAAWREVVTQLRPQAPSIALISLVTGKLVGQAALASPDHWAAQVRQPVRFLDGLYTLQASDVTLYLELGPQAVLSALGAQSLAGEAQPGALFVPSLRRSLPERETLFRALASLHVQGHALDWQRCLDGCGRRISLPTYAFQHERLWINSALAASPPQPALGSEPPFAPPLAATESGLELDGVLLQTAWRPTASVTTSGFTRTGRWLLLADHQGLANRIETQLECMGSAVVRVEMRRPKQPPPQSPLRGWHTVDPQDPEAIAAMLDKVAAAKQPLRGVIYLWGLDAPPLAAEAESLVHGSWSGALNVAQAIAARQWATVPRLHIVTLRACAPDTQEVPRAEQALLFGLGTMISAQLPALRCQQIDVAEPTSGQEAASLIKELFADGEESQLALRQDRRYVARILRHAPLPAPASALVFAGGRPFALVPEQHAQATLLVARPAQRRPPGPGEIEVAVAKAALPKADSSAASAVAGEVVAVGKGVSALQLGQAVVGLVPGSLASHVTAAAQLFVACPPELALERAVAGALGYPQVCHVLEQQAELGPADRLLILGVERGEGLAALHIGRRCGAEIFVAQPAGATHSVLAELAPDHIVDSAALPADFAVDLILNAGPTATPKELLPALRRGGTLIKLDLGRLIARRPERIHALLASTIAALATGALPRFEPRVVPLGDIALAVRLLDSGAVLDLVDASPLLLDVATQEPALAPGGTWLVGGSSSAAADAAADWLVQHDAERRTLPIAQAHAAASPLRGLVYVEEPLPTANDSRTAAIAQVLSGRVRAVWEVTRTAERLGIEELIVIASGAAWAPPVAAFADAALDAFVEALCRGLRRQGRQAVDLHYGRFGREGAQLLGLPADAVERAALLDSLLRARAAPPCILIQNAGARFKQLGQSSDLPLYRELLPERAVAGNGKLIGQLLALPLPEAAVHLAQLLRGRIAALLSADAASIDIQAPLNLLGVDSLTALELSSRLQSDLGLRIPGPILFAQGSIRSISEYLLPRLFSQYMHKELV